MNSKLTEIAKQTRILTLRCIKNAASGHPGGSLSCIEILTLLHCETMRPNPYHPSQAQDIFLLSAGHKFPALVALWSVLGWIPESEAMSLRKFGSPIQGHPSLLHTPWVHASSGSLGQVAAVSVGLALAYKRARLNRKVYCLVSEGDINEGCCLEAMRLASEFDLNNLVWIVDNNGRMSDRHSRLMVDPFVEFEVFGWKADWCDGHSFDELREALNSKTKGPLGIVAVTTKGRGVSFMESDPDGYHGSLCLLDDELARAIAELEGNNA